MSDPKVSYLDAAFLFLVSGAAYIWPPLAFIVGAAFFVATAIVNDRRTPEAQP